jgi:hypothetical protein
MKWTRLFSVRRGCARMVAAWWATLHPEEARARAPTLRVLGLAMATRVVPVVGLEDTGDVVRRKRLARRA